MKTRSRWLVTAAMICATGGPANADIDDALDDMFMTTGAEPGIYDSQRRGGLQMGTFRLRAPISSVNVLNFTPPEVRSGCGGIDLYGGSFTFINTEQFRQVLRQIGANAIGYAFKLALATMCAECDKILTGLQDMMNGLTNMSVDSCRWAQGIVNDVAKATNMKVNQEAMTTATMEGVFDDQIAAATALFNNAREFISGGDPSGADPDNTRVGNYTWNALREAGTEGLFDFAGGNLDHNEVLMNIAGTLIVRNPSDAEVALGTLGDVQRAWFSRLSFTELKSGKLESRVDTNDARRLLKCDEAQQCLFPTELEAWSFEGVDAWVSERLTTIADHMADPMTAGTPHPDADQEFLGSVPIDVMRHLVELQGSDGLTRYIEVAGPYLAASYTVVLGETMVGTIEAAYERSDVPDMPDTVKESIKAFKDEIREERRSVEERFGEKIIEIETLVDQLQKASRRNLPGTFSQDTQ